MAISYTRFKPIFGDLGITEWVKYNWLSNAGTARVISNEVIEDGYNPLAYVNDNLYNHITKTINLWDEEWELGDIDSSTGKNFPSSNNIRSKNYIDVLPNGLYYFACTKNVYLMFYDNDKNFIKYIDFAVNNNFTAPSNARYLRFRVNPSYGTTYNHDICINLSNPYLNGNYFPYFEGEKFLVLVGDVDLGSLTWIKSNNKFYIQDQISDMKSVSGRKTIPNFLCSKYQVVGQVNIVDSITDKSITMIFNSQKCIQIYDSELYSSMTATQFKSAMDGIPLYYQLNTPVLVDLPN